MNKKFLVSAVIMISVAVLAVLLGVALEFWEIGFKASSTIGFIIIIPAIIWVILKGVNYINSALYFGGIAFMMYKNVFNEFSLRFVLVFIFLVILAVVFAYFASLFKTDSESTVNINEKGQDESDG
ncbi:MAG: hypothetical protein E7509_07260 [Ruminococcus sp.]|nr:hypothetical protein [Ruminococcus sp.]